MFDLAIPDLIKTEGVYECHLNSVFKDGQRAWAHLEAWSQLDIYRNDFQKQLHV